MRSVLSFYKSGETIISSMNTGEINAERIDADSSNTGKSKTIEVDNNRHNTGFGNSGSLNAGDLNTGDYNHGDSNSGNRNEGSFNSGDFNSGSYNAGDWNYGSGCSGVFCTEEAHINFFDKPSELTISEWRKSEAYHILMRARTTLWVPETKMTLDEKLANPNYKQAGGYLKTCSIKEAFKILWAGLSPEEQNVIVNMPNFDPNKFLLVTGVRV